MLRTATGQSKWFLSRPSNEYSYIALHFSHSLLTSFHDDRLEPLIEAPSTKILVKISRRSKLSAGKFPCLFTINFLLCTSLRLQSTCYGIFSYKVFCCWMNGSSVIQVNIQLVMQQVVRERLSATDVSKRWPSPPLNDNFAYVFIGGHPICPSNRREAKQIQFH